MDICDVPIFTGFAQKGPDQSWSGPWMKILIEQSYQLNVFVSMNTRGGARRTSAMDPSG
jgi:hypothetical protein